MSEALVKLLPCPHCGNETKLSVREWMEEPAAGWGYYVRCDASGFDGQRGGRGCGASSGWGETPSDAIEAWNRRAIGATSPSPIVDEVAELAAKYVAMSDTAMGHLAGGLQASGRPVENALPGSLAREFCADVRRMAAALTSPAIPATGSGETADITGAMWVAGRDEFVRQADRYAEADRYEISMAIADRAPEKIYAAMRDASPIPWPPQFKPRPRDGGTG